MHRRDAEDAERRRKKGNCVGHGETVADAPTSPHCEPPLAMGGKGPCEWWGVGALEHVAVAGRDGPPTFRALTLRGGGSRRSLSPSGQKEPTPAPQHITHTL